MSNFHAKTLAGANFPSKKALRQAVANGDVVVLEDTSAFNNRGTVGVTDLNPSDVIVGPDPYRQRSWYANIQPGKGGGYKVV
jgi:hypothetical protein